MKLNNNNCFIAYSPLHVFLIDVIIEHLKMKRVTVYLPYYINYSFVSENIKVARYFYGGTGVGRYKKLLFFILNFIYVRKSSFNHLYVSNDADPFVMLFEKKFSYNILNFIEEGVTAFGRIQHKKSPNVFRSNSNFLKKIFGIERNDIALSSPNISRAFVFFPSLLEDFRPDIEYIDLGNILNNNSIYLSQSWGVLLREFKNIDILIATSPFTENGHCANFQEVDVIESVIYNNKSKIIVLKLHYRDSVEKYNRLIAKYKNVRILPRELNGVPYQALHCQLNPELLFAFHSSILFTIPSMRENFKRVSMLKLIDTDRSNAFYEGMVLVGNFFDDLYFYNQDGSYTRH